MGMKFVKKLAVVLLLLGLLTGGQVLYAAQPDSGADVSEDGDTPEDIGTGAAARLTLDSENRYDGMDKTYSKGYVPKVENGSVYLVAPILSSKNLKDNTIKVSLDLGDAQSAPFVHKNYEKNCKIPEGKGKRRRQKSKELCGGVLAGAERGPRQRQLSGYAYGRGGG